MDSEHFIFEKMAEQQVFHMLELLDHLSTLLKHLLLQSEWG